MNASTKRRDTWCSIPTSTVWSAWRNEERSRRASNLHQQETSVRHSSLSSVTSQSSLQNQNHRDIKTSLPWQGCCASSHHDERQSAWLCHLFGPNAIKLSHTYILITQYSIVLRPEQIPAVIIIIIIAQRSATESDSRGVWLAKKWLRFGFAKTCGFRFGFTKLTAVLFFLFFCTVYCLMCMHSTECFPVYCFIPVLLFQFHVPLPTTIICQLKWLRTAEIRHEEKYFVGRWTVNETMWKTVPKPLKSVSENCTVKTEWLVFELWDQFGSVFTKPISNIFTFHQVPHTSICQPNSSVFCPHTTSVVVGPNSGVLAGGMKPVARSPLHT